MLVGFKLAPPEGGGARRKPTASPVMTARGGCIADIRGYPSLAGAGISASDGRSTGTHVGFATQEAAASRRRRQARRVPCRRCIDRLGGNQQAQVDRRNQRLDDPVWIRVGGYLASRDRTRHDRLGTPQSIFEEALFDRGDLWNPTASDHRRDDGAAARTVEPRDDRGGMLAKVGFQAAGVWHAYFTSDVIGERIHHERFAILPATVDRGLVDTSALGDALNAEFGITDGREFGERRGQHGGTHLRTAPDGPRPAISVYRNIRLRCSEGVAILAVSQQCVAMIEEGA